MLNTRMRLLPRHSPPAHLGRLALSALAGFLLALVLARGGLSVVLAVVPPGQPYVRAVVGTLAALGSLVLSFGLAGALSARALPLARLGLSRGQARVRAGVASGVTAGLLVVPVGGLMGLAGVYRGGALGDALGGSQLALLALVLCALYGLISGAVLGLLTLRARLAWRPALGGLLGFGLVGAVGGALLGWAGVPNVLAGAAGRCSGSSRPSWSPRRSWGTAPSRQGSTRRRTVPGTTRRTTGRSSSRSRPSVSRCWGCGVWASAR